MLRKKIKELCNKRGITIYRLEKELGFSSACISKWDTSSPSVEKAKKVADYLGVTVDELLAESAEGPERVAR